MQDNLSSVIAGSCSCLEAGIRLMALAMDQATWSQETFGKDPEYPETPTGEERGPIGALKHLEREAREAQAQPLDVTEYADCLLLVLDSSRRAGFRIRDLITAAENKMVINKARRWPKTHGDVPTEHVREEVPCGGTA